MLQIRLNKASAPETVSKTSNLETVTVACPDHLVLADLPVAKFLGSAVTAATASTVKTVGRRSRRAVGDRVHFCVRCDFPIAIYGRLSPCEHAFCLTCARSDSSCHICDERIQKIHTIKMLEGIFVCAAPHCLKSFLIKSEFREHIHQVHSDLLPRPSSVDQEGNAEVDPSNTPRPSFANASDAVLIKQTPMESFSYTQPKQANFSPDLDCQQIYDRDDRRPQPREAGPVKPLQLPGPPPPAPVYYGRQPSTEPHLENNLHQQSCDMAVPYGSNNSSINLSQQLNMDKPLGLVGGSYQRESDHHPNRQAGVFPESGQFFDHQVHQQQQMGNFSLPISMASQGLNLSMPYGYQSALPAELAISQQNYNNSSFQLTVPQPEPKMGLQDQGTFIGSSRALPTGGLSGGYSRPWIGVNSPMIPSFESLASPIAQGLQDGYGNALPDTVKGSVSTQSQERDYQSNYSPPPRR